MTSGLMRYQNLPYTVEKKDGTVHLKFTDAEGDAVVHVVLTHEQSRRLAGELLNAKETAA